MSPKKKKQKQKATGEATPSVEQLATTAGSATTVPPRAAEFPWAGWKRMLASAIIVGYLFLLIIGPLSNPISSRHLTAPIAETLAPLHRGLFMGHGYRFFAPNPGDSHLVKYKITKNDGTQLKGLFPDRDNVWPRLLYHRWFMLSETIFAEHAQTLSPDEFDKINRNKVERVNLLKSNAQFKLASALENQRSQEEARHKRTIRRIKALVRSTGEFLLRRHDGDEIEISVVTRTIPFPVEVSQGADLDDEVFLRYPANRVIGRFKKSDFADSPAATESIQ